jgi:hypothetical protein
MLRTSSRRMTIKKMSWHFRLLLLCLYYRFFAITNCSSTTEEGNIPPKIFHSSLQGKELRIVTGHVIKDRTEKAVKITHSKCLLISVSAIVISILRNSSGHIIGYSDQLYLQFLYLAKKLKFT